MEDISKNKIEMYNPKSLELLSTHLKVLFDDLIEKVDSDYDFIFSEQMACFLATTKPTRFDDQFLTEYDNLSDLNFNKNYMILHLISSVYEHINYIISNGFTLTDNEDIIFELLSKNFSWSTFLKDIKLGKKEAIVNLERIIDIYFHYDLVRKLYIERCRNKIVSNNQELQNMFKNYNPFFVFEYANTDLNMNEDERIIIDLLYMHDDVLKNEGNLIYSAYNTLYVFTSLGYFCIDTTELNETIEERSSNVLFEDDEFEENFDDYTFLPFVFYHAVSSSLLKEENIMLRNKIIRVIMKYFSLLNINEEIPGYESDAKFNQMYLLEDKNNISNEFINYILDEKHIYNIVLSVLSHPRLEEKIIAINKQNKRYIKK